MKINCSFIVPVNDEKQFKKFTESLEEYDEYEVIPIRGAKSFFDAWRQGIKKAKKKYLVLTHQDTEFVGIPDLDKYFKKGVGMVGTAGTTVLHKDQPWWFSRERLDGSILSGQVFYNDTGKPTASIFGPFGEVVVLDGVCLITTKDILEDVGIPDGYGWDWYDHVISLEYIKKGYKLLTIPLVIVHGSKGGDKRSDFYDDGDRFRKEYLDKTWRT